MYSDVFYCTSFIRYDSDLMLNVNVRD